MKQRAQERHDVQTRVLRRVERVGSDVRWRQGVGNAEAAQVSLIGAIEPDGLVV